MERSLAAGGRADAELVERAERLALGERQADHHADVVAVALDALGLLAEKRGADLAGEFALGEAERLAFGADGDVQFVAVAAGIVPGVGDAVVGFEHVFDFLHHARPCPRRPGRGSRW